MYASLHLYLFHSLCSLVVSSVWTISMWPISGQPEIQYLCWRRTSFFFATCSAFLLNAGHVSLWIPSSTKIKRDQINNLHSPSIVKCSIDNTFSTLGIQLLALSLTDLASCTNPMDSGRKLDIWAASHVISWTQTAGVWHQRCPKPDSMDGKYQRLHRFRANNQAHLLPVK